jgi:hypothetical protein
MGCVSSKQDTSEQTPVPSSRGPGGRVKPAVDVQTPSGGWNLSERLSELEERVPAFALTSRTGKTAGRAYVGAINRTTGDTALASSGGLRPDLAYCAEGNALRELGGNPDNVVFTDAYVVKSYRILGDDMYYWAAKKPVCTGCQVDYPEPEGTFVPGVTGEPGGTWEQAGKTDWVAK